MQTFKNKYPHICQNNNNKKKGTFLASQRENLNIFREAEIYELILLLRNNFSKIDKNSVWILVFNF
jgi:hypothetical protein